MRLGHAEGGYPENTPHPDLLQRQAPTKDQLPSSDLEFTLSWNWNPTKLIISEIEPKEDMPGGTSLKPKFQQIFMMVDDQLTETDINSLLKSIQSTEGLDNQSIQSNFAVPQTHTPNQQATTNSLFFTNWDVLEYQREKTSFFNKLPHNKQDVVLPIYHLQKKKQLNGPNCFVTLAVLDGTCSLNLDAIEGLNQIDENLETSAKLKVKLKETGCEFLEEMKTDQTRPSRRSCLFPANVRWCSCNCTSSDDAQSGSSPSTGDKLNTNTTEKQHKGSAFQFGPERSKDVEKVTSGLNAFGNPNLDSIVDCSRSYSNETVDLKNNIVITFSGRLTYNQSLLLVIINLMRRLKELLICGAIPKLINFAGSMFSRPKLPMLYHHHVSTGSGDFQDEKPFRSITNRDENLEDDGDQTYKQIKSAPLGSASMVEAYSSTECLQTSSLIAFGQPRPVCINNSVESTLSALGLNFYSGTAKIPSKRQRKASKTKSFPRLLFFFLFVTCFFDSALAQLESGGWLLSNLLSLPNECTMEGALAPCTFLLTCLIQGGTPVNKCGGGYIYTCCVPTRMAARGAMSVRSDHRPSMPTLRHIGSLFRDAPSPSHAAPQSNLILPHRVHPPEVMSPSRLPWRQKGSWFSDERLDAIGNRNYIQNSEGGALGNSLVPIGHNVVSSEDALASYHLGSSTQDLGFALNYKPPDTKNDIYYNEPECGVQKLSTTHISKRIIGGNEAQFAELPWQAHIRIAGYQCGGVLVNRYYVATAAHCVHKARLRDITIHLGEFDTKDTGRHYEPYPKESFGVVEKRTHPNFKYMLTQPDRFDVAVLRLSRPVQYRPNIVPICLPPPGDHFSGMIGLVAGWGKTDNSYGKTGTNILRKVSVPIIDNQECLRWHHLKNIDVKLHYEMFCAGHSEGKMDACLGDSGGPLVVNNKGRWTLAGITSAGFGCAVDHQPGIYHKVAITSGWIAANVRP